MKGLVEVIDVMSKAKGTLHVQAVQVLAGGPAGSSLEACLTIPGGIVHIFASRAVINKTPSNQSWHMPKDLGRLSIIPDINLRLGYNATAFAFVSITTRCRIRFAFVPIHLGLHAFR